jgi:uncharacterized surface protein with fasciclin (FAS1) repeats
MQVMRSVYFAKTLILSTGLSLVGLIALSAQSVKASENLVSKPSASLVEASSTLEVSTEATMPAQTPTEAVSPEIISPDTITPAVEKPAAATIPAVAPTTVPTAATTTTMPGATESTPAAATEPMTAPMAESPTAAPSTTAPSATEPSVTEPSVTGPAVDATVEASVPITSDPEKTIVEIAGSSDSFEILTAMLQAAELTDELSGTGPFTLFAPTDAAFEALPEGMVEALLLPENRNTLIQILAYHVLPQAVSADALTTGEIATVQGSPLMVSVGDAASPTAPADTEEAPAGAVPMTEPTAPETSATTDPMPTAPMPAATVPPADQQPATTEAAITPTIQVNQAMVLQADVEASNGMIYVIDQVMLPPAITAGL